MMVLLSSAYSNQAPNPSTSAAATQGPIRPRAPMFASAFLVDVPEKEITQLHPVVADSGMRSHSVRHRQPPCDHCIAHRRMTQSKVQASLETSSKRGHDCRRRIEDPPQQWASHFDARNMVTPSSPSFRHLCVSSMMRRVHVLPNEPRRARAIRPTVSFFSLASLDNSGRQMLCGTLNLRECQRGRASASFLIRAPPAAMRRWAEELP